MNYQNKTLKIGKFSIEIAKSVVIICLFSFLFVVQTNTVIAASSFEDLSAEQTINAKLLWDYLRGEGYTQQAAAGILGNAMQESALLNKNGVDYNDGKGFFGWIKGVGFSYADGYDAWCKENNLRTSSIVSQYRWMLETSEHPSVATDFSLTSENKTKWGVDIPTLAQFKQLVDVKLASDWWLVGAEKAVGGTESVLIEGITEKYQDAEARRKWSSMFLVGLAGAPVTESDGGSVFNPGEVSDASWANDKTVSGGGVDKGVRDEAHFGVTRSVKDTRYVDLPGVEGLTEQEFRALVDWKLLVSLEDEAKWTSFLGTFMRFLGILLMVYSVILFALFWLDKIDIFLNLRWLYIASFGFLTPDADGDAAELKKPISGRTRYVTRKGMVGILFLGMVVGLLLVSGYLYYGVEWIIHVVKTGLS